MKLPVGYVAGKGAPKATAYGGYGQRMLESMGWEKGQGLGKSKDGITQAIEVQKKEDTLGVGAEQASWDWSWKYWEEAYNSAVQKVDHEGGGASSSDSSDSDSDGGKAAATAKAKAKRKSKGKVQHNRDGTVASATQDELKLAAQLAADPWGRWGGRGGKMARIRKQEAAEAAQMRASLGLPPLPAAPAAGAGSDSSDSSDSSGSESEGEGGKARKAKAAEESVAQQQPPKKKPLVVVLTIKEDPNRKKPVFQRTPATGWWGASYFASAGAMANLEDEMTEEGAEGAARVPRQRQAFDEGDQEDLYMRVHENQRVGKRGLGKSSTLKIAGGKWEGTKLTFEGDGEEGKGGVAAAAEALMEGEEEEKGGKKGKGKKRKGGLEEKGEGKVVEEVEGKGKEGKKKAKRESAAAGEVEGDGGAKKKKAKGESGAGGEVAGETKVEGGKKKTKGESAAALDAEAEPKVEGGKKKTKGESAAALDAEAEPKVEGGKKKKAKAKEESKAAAGEEVALQEQEAGGPAARKKWLKAACKLLKKAPEQRLKTRLLMQQLQAHGAALSPPEAAGPSLDSLTRLCTADLKVKGSHLALQGKYVVLVGA